MNTLAKLKKKVIEFRNARNWEQFHNPKDLVQALSIEASELSELFLWVSPSKSYDVVHQKREQLSDEMADVLIYLLSLSDITGVDLETAVIAKLQKNNMKYPVDKCKNKMVKYTEL